MPLHDQLKYSGVAPWLQMMQKGIENLIHPEGDVKSQVGPNGPAVMDAPAPKPFSRSMVGPNGPAVMDAPGPQSHGMVSPDGPLEMEMAPNGMITKRHNGVTEKLAPPAEMSVPGLNQMDSGSNNRPGVTTPAQAQDPEADTVPPGTLDTPTTIKKTLKPLGTFKVRNADDLRLLKSAKTPEDLEAIKQQILQHGGAFAPATGQ